VVARVWRWTATGVIWGHLLTTSVEAALSLGIGAGVGVVSGFVLARIPVLAALFDPYIRIANALPRVILAPIFLISFGLGIRSKIALGVTIVIFVVFVKAYRGVREVDPVMIDNARVLGASERQLITHVLIPSALTWISVRFGPRRFRPSFEASASFRFAGFRFASAQFVSSCLTSCLPDRPHMLVTS
jgi:NitT/TauT family transport system permease protein